MASPTTNEAAVREAVRAIIAPMSIDKIIGQPSNSTVNLLKQQVAKIAAAVKTTSWGGRHGHLALVLNDDEYRLVTFDATQTTTRLVAPPIVPTALANNTTITLRARITADHNLECQEFWKQEAVDAVIVEKIVREGVDAPYNEELDDDFIGYSTQMVKTIIEHLRREWCIVTTLERKQAAAAFHIQWDLTSQITKFARDLDKQQKLCRDIGVPAADATKIQYYVESMYTSDIFDDKEMQAWEIKPTEEKTCEAAKTHFVTLYKSKEKFNAERLTRTDGYASAYSIVSEPFFSGVPATVVSTTGTMSPSDQHSMMEYTDHAAFLTTAQNQLLQKLECQQEELLTQTTKFMTLLNTKTPTPTPTPTNTNTGHPRSTRNARPSKNPRFPRHCNSCNKEAVHHEDDKCYALDKNKDKMPTWYVAPNKLKSSAPQLLFESKNYWAPLSNTSHHRPTVRFRLPTQHRDTDSKTWRRQQSQKTHHRFTTHHTSKTPSMSTTALKQGILNGSIASAISDTGATSTAGAPHDPFNETTTISSKVFLLPTGGTAKATKVAKLLHKVRTPANMVDIVPSLEHTLLSGSKFADAGYTTVYDKAEVNFYDANTIHITEKAVLTGYRCTRTGLWRVPLRPVITNKNKDTLILDSTCGHQSKNTRYKIPPTTKIRNYLSASLEREKHSILNVYELPSIEQTIRYLHAAAGYPTKNTWLKAIRHGNYSTWPLITIKNVNKHFPQSEETQQGHMKNQRQGVRSTKQHAQPIAPPPTHPQQNDIYIKTYDTNNTLYTDQTGKFPHVSSRGYRYQMILYHVASNSIWVEPTKNRTEGKLFLAHSRALLRMKACNITPQHQVLDNKISAAYREAITTSAMTYQLVPPDDHRRNIAEKAIQTWKDHFVSALSGTADNFSLHLWCQLIPQMERQLNLLRQSNNNPKISSYAHLYGHHDYNSHPFAPIGMEALVHDKPHRQKSFAQHCTKGFVLGTSPEHYRCWTVWTPASQSTCISATVFFKHKYITNPTVTPADAIIAATANLAHVLMSNTTAAHLNTTQLADLTRLHKIIQPTPTDKSAVPPTVTTRLPTAPKRTHPIVSYSDSDKSPQSSKSTPLRPLPTQKQPAAYTPRVSTTPPQRHINASPRVTPPPAPAYNTGSRMQTITQETMLHFSQLPTPTVTAQRAASRMFPTDFLNAVLNENTGELMEYRHLIKDRKYSTTWKKAYGKELGRLAQGIPGLVQGTNTIVFITKDDVPTDRRRGVTYGRICANFRPEKKTHIEYASL
eukprot:CCRYP_002274-RA/>CCRYP_002274-RA protein AED:0.23 eAED:0.09 QI:0/0/0/1/0/0/2/0/1265